jgi:hypothetical protein
MDMRELPAIWIFGLNDLKIEQAFKVFGMPVFDMTKENFLHHPSWDVFTFGTPPVAIDLMVNMKGLDFQKIFERSTVFTDEGLSIRLIHINDLIIAKRKAGGPKDLDDLENLR